MTGDKTVTINRKARFTYDIEDSVEVGLVLMGSEVKALRAGKASIQEAYAGEKQGELWLMNATVGVYDAAVKAYRHEERRARKLLMKRQQRDRWLGLVKRDRYSLVPLKLYFNQRGFAKLQLGLGKGRQQADKRQHIKEREWRRQKKSMI